MAETGLTGDWKGAIARVRALRDGIHAEEKLATERNCQGFVAEIQEGIETQKPGGKPLGPELHPYTVLRRLAGYSPKRQEEMLQALAGGKSAKALLNHGDLWRSFTYRLSKDGWSGAVGINRQAVTKDGTSMVNIASVLFHGKVIAVTPRMRAYLGATGLHLKASTTHIVIPARDPVTPTFVAYKPTMLDRYRQALRAGAQRR
jgi:hypothetical protein